VIDIQNVIIWLYPSGGERNGELVWDCKAGEEGTRPSRATVVRAECGTHRFCWCLSWDGETGTQKTPQDVSEVPSEDCSRTESTVGEGESREEVSGFEVRYDK
jgi:hypothetical protein